MKKNRYSPQNRSERYRGIYALVHQLIHRLGPGETLLATFETTTGEKINVNVTRSGGVSKIQSGNSGDRQEPDVNAAVSNPKGRPCPKCGGTGKI